ASAAIYGSRAANGVVLVTTKQGKPGKLTLSYDAYIGWQNAYRMPSLLTAKEYMTVMDEVRFNEGQTPYNWAALITKQYQQIQDDDCLTHNYALNLNGGTEQSNFYLSYSYFVQ